MNIYIDNKMAVLPKNFSMEYTQENRLFGQSDGYTLAITLPLRGCPENIAIFGNVMRKDVAYSSVTYPCVISHAEFIKYGIVIPVSISESEIEVQFLEGRSSVKHDTILKDTYINKLTLPYIASVTPTAQTTFDNVKDIDDGQYYLALPWINNYSGNIQNKISSSTTVDQTTGKTYYPITTNKLSYQIYLVKLAEMIFTALGFTYDLTRWYSSKWKYLLVWNALPSAWDKPNFNDALPCWTVLEFIQNIEYLTGMDFFIDEKNKRIVANLGVDILSRTVVLDSVVEEYTQNIDEDNEVAYREFINLQYEDRTDKDWSIESCSCSMPILTSGVYFWGRDYWSAMYSWRSGWVGMNAIEYAPVSFLKDINDYIEFKVAYAKVINSTIFYLLEPKFVNCYGATTTDPDASITKVGIVPVWIADCTVDESDYTANISKHCVILDCGELDDSGNKWPQDLTEAMTWRNKAERLADEKTSQKDEEVFNTLFVSFWKKDMAHALYDQTTRICLKQNFNQSGVTHYLRMPENGMMSLFNGASEVTNAIYDMDMTLKMRQGALKNLRAPEIKSLVKYSFKWISKTVPEVMSTFVINNRKYLCAKIKTTWTTDGRSELLEGEFYELA